MKKLYIILFAVALSSTALATVVNQHSVANISGMEQAKFGNATVYAAPTPKLAEDVSTKIVEFKSEHESTFMPSYGFLIDEDGTFYSAYAGMMSFMPATVTVAPGTYDVLFSYVSYEHGPTNPVVYYWIKEGVVIDEAERTIITAKAAEVTNVLKARSCDPQGKPWTMPEATNEYGTFEGEGTASVIYYYDGAFVNGRYLTGYFCNYFCKPLTATEWDESTDIHVSPCSDKFSFVHTRYVHNAEHTAVHYDSYEFVGGENRTIAHDG